MVSYFIKKKEVKDFLTKHFPKPKVRPNPIIYTEKSTNPSNLGYAFELYTLCYYDYLFNKNKKSIRSNAFMLEINEFLTKVKEKKLAELHIAYSNIYSYSLNKILKNKTLKNDVLKTSKINQVNLISLNDFLPNIKINSDSLLKIYSLEEIESNVIKFIEYYKIFLKDGKITTDFLCNLLMLQNFNHPLYFMFTHKSNDEIIVSEIDLNILKELINQFPKNFFGTSNINKIKTQKALMAGFVNGRPDFIHNDKIIEIKTTTEFFTQNHYHQILCYLFLYIADQSIQNATNYTKADFLKECHIRELEIYYPYFNQSVIISVDYFYDQPNFNNLYNEFLSLTENLM